MPFHYAHRTISSVASMDSTRCSRLLRRAGVGLSALLLAVSLSACAGAAEPAGEAPAPPVEGTGTAQSTETDAGAEGGSAQLVLDAATFSFTTAHCHISGSDVLAHGPGADDATGEPAYLDVDFVSEDGMTTGVVTVSLGATSQFESTDDAYAFDTEYFAGEYTLGIAGDMELRADFRLNGADPAPGTLIVSC